MNNDLVESPFGPTTAIAESASSRALQQRENAETLAMVAMAKRFPRDVIANMDKILNAFTRPTLAEKAAYQFAKGGTDVSGPSIRAAEAMAQMWGNLNFGFSELSRGMGQDGVPYSEVEAYCWDLEGNNRQPLKFIVRHWRDTKGGGYKIKDERDIYELMANQAQRRKRACILALIPGDVVEAAMKQAEVTLRSKADTSPEAMAKMVEVFAEFGVTKEQIEKRIQRRLDSIQPAQVVQLKRVYASLRDDMSVPADWFEMPEEGKDGSGNTQPRATPAPTAAPERTPFPQNLFDKSLPTWRAAIEGGKKTADQIITTLQTKNTLNPAQVEAIRGKKAEAAPAAAGTDGDGVITFSFNQISAKLNAATNMDELAEAASLINSIGDPSERGGLVSLYDRRGAELAIAN